MRLTNVEKETVINFNEAERTASVYTCNETLKRQLLELCRSNPDQVCQTAANADGGLTFGTAQKVAEGIAAPCAVPGAEGGAEEDESKEAGADLRLGLFFFLATCYTVKRGD